MSRPMPPSMVSGSASGSSSLTGKGPVGGVGGFKGRCGSCRRTGIGRVGLEEVGVWRLNLFGFWWGIVKKN